MPLTLNEIIDALITARDAVNGVDGNSFPEVWVNGMSDNAPSVEEIISDVNGVAILTY